MRRNGVVAGVVALAWIVAPGSSSLETRAQDVRAASSSQHPLDPQQVEAVKQFAGSAPRTELAAFTLAVGAAMPQSVELRDMPRALGEALPVYINDQYLVVGNQFVIVEKNTRRIIAIVPIS